MFIMSSVLLLVGVWSLLSLKSSFYRLGKEFINESSCLPKTDGRSQRCAVLSIVSSIFVLHNRDFAFFVFERT